MNLSSMLQERAAAGRPIRIGQIGAGKFGTMFLSQVRLTTGMHLVGLADLMPARAQRAADRRRLAGGADRGQLDGRRAEVGQDLRHRRCNGRDRQPRYRRGDRGDRRPGDRHQAVPGGHQARQAHRHGQRRGRRAGRAAAGAARARGGRCLLAGLGRPAGADLRARRLGARLRVPGWSPPARARATTRAITSPRPRQCGTSSCSICRSRTAATSIPRCSTRSSTAPSRASR